MDDAQDVREYRSKIEARERVSLGWRYQWVGVGVTRCPSGEDGHEPQFGMGYVPARETA